jgi:hypothetical protein
LADEDETIREAAAKVLTELDGQTLYTASLDLYQGRWACIMLY